MNSKLLIAVVLVWSGLLSWNASAIEPVQARSIEPYKAKTIEPYKAQTIEPYQAKTIEPYQAQTIEPIKTETISPVQAQPVEPTKAQIVEPQVVSKNNATPHQQKPKKAEKARARNDKPQAQGLNQAQIDAMEAQRRLMWNATGGDMIYR